MHTATGTAFAPISAHRKTVARVALFDLPESSSALVTECFRQFGVETVPLLKTSHTIILIDPKCRRNDSPPERGKREETSRRTTANDRDPRMG